MKSHFGRKNRDAPIVLNVTVTLAIHRKFAAPEKRNNNK